MADLKLTDLTTITQANVDNNVLLYVVDVTGGTVDRKVTRQNLYLAVANTWTKGQSFTPDTATALAVTPPTGPTGSGSPFFAGLSILTATVAFATTAQTGDYDTAFIGQATLTNPSSGTITNAASLKIVGAPIASTNVTITNNYSLWVAGGVSRFDEQVKHTSTLNTALYTTAASAPVGSSSEFVGGMHTISSTVAFATTNQTGDYLHNKIGQATITNPTSATITNAATLKILGSPIAGSNVTITNAYSLWVAAGTTLLQTTTMAGTLTMSSADIALGINRIKTGNFDIYEAAAAGQDGVNVIPYNAIGGVFSIGTGVGGVTGLQIISTTDITTNYKLLRIDQGLTSGDWTISSVKAGSATLSPINILMGATKLLSFDTALSVTNYVYTNITFASGGFSMFDIISTSGNALMSVTSPSGASNAEIRIVTSGQATWSLLANRASSNFQIGNLGTYALSLDTSGNTTFGGKIIPQTMTGTISSTSVDASSGTTFNITTGATATPSGNANNFSGLMVIKNTSSGHMALVLTAGSTMVIVSQDATEFTTSSTPGASNTGIFLSSQVITMKNGFATTQTYIVWGLRSWTAQ